MVMIKVGGAVYISCLIAIAVIVGLAVMLVGLSVIFN